MSFQSLTNMSNWLYSENDGYGTYSKCKEEIYKLFPEYENKEDWVNDFAEELYKLNCESLKERYGDKNFKKFEFQSAKIISKIQLLKSVQCWIYQSCEGNTKEKPLFKLMVEIENTLLNSVVMDLEEYKNADWA